MKLSALNLLPACLLLTCTAWAEPAPSPAPAAVVRSSPPAVTGQAPGIRLPEIAERHLDNGIPVYICVNNKQFIEQISLVSAGGGAKNDLPGKHGLAWLAAKGMLTGDGEHGAAYFSEAIQAAGAVGCDVDVTWDRCSVSLECPADKLSEATDLFAYMLMHPAFSPREIELVKNNGLNLFNGRKHASWFLSDLAFNRIVFGDNSRYGDSERPEMSPQLAGVTRDDAVRYYQTHFRPGRVFFWCSGSADPDALTELLNKNFGSWQADSDIELSAAAAVPQRQEAAALTAAAKWIPADLPAGKNPLDGRLIVVDKPGAKQSSLCLGCLGISVKDPEAPALQVMSAMLGNMGVSDRLNANLREDKGYTYGLSSKFDRRLDRGAFKITGEIQADKTVAALREIFREIEGMHRPVSETELKTAREYLAYTVPIEFVQFYYCDKNMQDMIVGYYSGDYLDNYVSLVLNLTPADIQKAADRILDADKMIVVIVGDAKALEPQLKEAGWRAQVVTPEDVIGSEYKAE